MRGECFLPVELLGGQVSIFALLVDSLFQWPVRIVTSLKVDGQIPYVVPETIIKFSILIVISQTGANNRYHGCQ